MALTLRLVKGTPLTNAELDGNFTYLRDEILARARYGSGLPAASLGVDGDFYVRTDEPFDGVLYKKAAGAWTTPKRSYTWAEVQSTLLPASNYDGCVITVSDWGQDFVSSNNSWIPTSKRLVLLQDCVRQAPVVGSGVANQLFLTDTVPGGLVVDGCRVDIHGLIDWQGPSTDTHCIAISHLGVQPVRLTASSGGGSMHFYKSIYVENATNLTRWFANSQSASDFSSTSNTTHISDDTTFDWTVDLGLDWVAFTALAATSTIAIVARSIEIIYK